MNGLSVGVHGCPAWTEMQAMKEMRPMEKKTLRKHRHEAQSTYVFIQMERQAVVIMTCKMTGRIDAWVKEFILVDAIGGILAFTQARLGRPSHEH